MYQTVASISNFNKRSEEEVLNYTQKSIIKKLQLSKKYS